jgi:hypothetical protein
LGQKFFNGFLIEFVGLTLHKFKGTRRAFPQAGPQPVTIYFGNYTGFAVYNFQRALSTGRNAIAATVTEFFVDFDNFTYGFHFSLL